MVLQKVTAIQIRYRQFEDFLCSVKCIWDIDLNFPKFLEESITNKHRKFHVNSCLYYSNIQFYINTCQRQRRTLKQFWRRSVPKHVLASSIMRGSIIAFRPHLLSSFTFPRPSLNILCHLYTSDRKFYFHCS